MFLLLTKAESFSHGIHPKEPVNKEVFCEFFGDGLGIENGRQWLGINRKERAQEGHRVLGCTTCGKKTILKLDYLLGPVQPKPSYDSLKKSASDK